MVKIGLVIAVDIKAFKQKYGIPDKTITVHNQKIDKYVAEHYELYVIHAGAGEIAAASATQLLISECHVEIIANYGLVGGLTEEVSKHRMCVVKGVVHYDFDTSASDHCEVGRYLNYPEVVLPVNDELLKIALETEPELVPVLCASGDKFIADPSLKQNLYEQFGTEICEMEAAGIVLTSNRNGIPCLLIKMVADGLNGGAEEYHEKFDDTSEKCLQLFDKILNYIAQEKEKMFSLVADIHTHSIASGHSYGTVREMAQVAAEKGLKILGITEHGPGIPGTVHPFYFKGLDIAPKKLYGVDILHGCEINVLKDGKLSLEEPYMKWLDYAIVGIHKQCYKDAGKEKNTDNVIKCMQHPKVKFISHPDDDNTPLDYVRLVQAAKEYGVALEVNNSSFLKQEKRKNCLENYRTMLKLCEEYQVPIIVSSDAHDPEYVGRFEEAVNFIEEVGFNKALILNGDEGKLKQFISRNIERTRLYNRG